MGLYDKLEKFHDNNRYFIPLMFVAVILMANGLLFVGPVSLKYSINITKPLFFTKPVVIQALMLRPGWEFIINVNSSKPLNLQLIDFNNKVVSTGINTLSYSPKNLDFYFIKVNNFNYTIYDVYYVKRGIAPYPEPYLFFGCGLLLLLGVIIYYFLEPWGFKLKRKMNLTDSLFYSLSFFISSLILLLFKELFVWLIPDWLLILVSSLILVFSAFVLIQLKESNLLRVFLGFLIAYSSLLIVSYIDFSTGDYYITLLVKFLFAVLLFYIFLKSREKTPLIFYLLVWAVNLSIRLLAFSIRIPVFFDTLLTIPLVNGAIILLSVLEIFAILGFYFLLRAYYSKNINTSSSCGLYAGVFISIIFQVLVVSLW